MNQVKGLVESTAHAEEELRIPREEVDPRRLILE
jgi:hypothetical protein